MVTFVVFDAPDAVAFPVAEENVDWVLLLERPDVLDRDALEADRLELLEELGP